MHKRLSVSIIALYGLLFLVNDTFGVNLSCSAPKGVYLKYPASTLRRGHYISFCPSLSEFSSSIVERGYVTSGACRNGGLPLLKKVVAAEGDRVTVTDDGVQVNEQLLPNSAPLRADSKDRPLPQLRTSFVLGESELWVSSNEAKGLDSRYLGPISRGDVLNRQVPLWIYG